jgi:hypothetical protein
MGIMTSPAQRRFDRDYLPIADAISRADIGQVNRERVAAAVTAALTGRPDFKADLFRHLASDPYVTCAGNLDGPCPHGREIRIPMHLSTAPDGRGFMWQETLPTEVRCATCGFDTFVNQ